MSGSPCDLMYNTCVLVVYLLTDLCGLNDSKVIHTGNAGAHRCSQTCCTKLHPGGETFLQCVHCFVLYQILHHGQCLWVLGRKHTPTYAFCNTRK